MTASQAVSNFAQYTATTVAGSSEAWQARQHRMDRGFGGDMEQSSYRHESNGDHPKDSDIKKNFPIVIDHRAIDYEMVESGDSVNQSSHIRNNSLDRHGETSRRNVDGWSDQSSKNEPTFWSTTSFYGMTDITILVLFPYLNPHKKNNLEISSKKESNNLTTNPRQDENSLAILAALAPELKLGLATRRAGDKKYPGNVDELNTARIGPIEISVGGRYDENVLDELDEDPDHPEDHPRNKRTQPMSDIVKKDISMKDISQSMQDAFQKTTSRMVTNFNLICNELSDDFLSRTISSGERVLDTGGKTLLKMKKLLTDVYDHWADSHGKRG
jgi:hypothetical protein